MDTSDFQHLISNIEALPTEQKRQLKAIIEDQLRSASTNGNSQNGAKRGTVNFGWAKGMISIAPDFDEPLEDFRVYTE